MSISNIETETAEMASGDETVRTRSLRLEGLHWETEGITSLRFTDPEGAPLPVWKPGAHVSLQLPNGLTREYSLCSDPSDTTGWTVAVLKVPDSRGGSQSIHEDLKVGTVIAVDGPRNNFSLEPAGHYAFVAGGIGITPIISMIRHVQAIGAEWSLLYTGRSRSSMAFLDEIGSLPAHRVAIHADDEADGQFPDLAAAVGGICADTLVYVCGPEPLMNAVAGSMADESQLRLERFKAPEIVVDPNVVENSFDVICQSSGERVSVGPGTSVLDALLDAGLDLPSSCTEGICGTCEVGVLRGDVDHRDLLLSPAEQAANKTMFICVSRCRSAELVLDI